MERLRTIVLIDDNDIVNFFNKDLIEESNIADKVIIFDNPVNALAFFSEPSNIEENMPMIVMVDIKMPQMEGFQFMNELESRDVYSNENFKFCMLTSSNLKRDVEVYERFPEMIGFLEKPLSLIKLKPKLFISKK